MSIIDKFGFLPVEVNFDSADCKISTVANFYDIKKDLEQILHRDGFIYPPIEEYSEVDPITRKPIKKVPHTKRPAHLHHLPPSHQIECKGSTILTQEELRNDLFGFVIHLLGYVYDIRLQFYDWWFDGRVPFKGSWSFDPTDSICNKFLSHSLGAFKAWAGDDRRFFINILFMHNRVASYEWDWERFTVEYMVFDACWKLAKKINNFPRTNHADRIKTICNHYGLYYDNTVVNDIVTSRNDLFHEALWGGGTPGATDSKKAYYASLNLRKLNKSIILVLLNYNSIFAKSNWTTFGSYFFD